MSEEISMKQALLEMGLLFPKRYNVRSKRHFINYLTSKLDEKGISHTSICINQKPKTKHLCIGDLKQAKKVLIVQYDTANLMLLPNYCYTPLNAKKVMINERKNSLIYTLISFVFLIIIVLITISIKKYDLFIKMIVILVDIILAYFSCMFANGLPKKNNMNSNSSAMAVLYRIIMNHHLTNTAMIFVDRVAMLNLGYLQISQLEELNKKEVLILSCIGAGGNCYACSTSKMKKIANLLVEEINGSTLKILKEEDMIKSVVGMFVDPIFIFNAEEIKGEINIQNTRSKKDFKVNIEQLETIERAIVHYCLNPRVEEDTYLNNEKSSDSIYV